MFSDREADWLGHIVDYADDAIAYLAGMSLEDFKQDRKTIDAAERCIERLAEAAARIGDARFAELTGGLRLAPVRGMGNALRHAYDRIDSTTVFMTVREDLPPLRDACAATLARRAPDA